MSVAGRTESASTGARLEYVNIGSGTTSATWGDISSAQYGATQCEPGAIGGTTRGVLWNAKSGATNIVEYWTWSSTGDTSDFGDTSTNCDAPGDAGCEDTIRGIMYTIGGGWTPSGQGSENIEYITMASTSNTSDFGDATEYVNLSGSFSDGKRPESCGGKWYREDNDAYTTETHI